MNIGSIVDTIGKGEKTGDLAVLNDTLKLILANVNSMVVKQSGIDTTLGFYKNTMDAVNTEVKELLSKVHTLETDMALLKQTIESVNNSLTKINSTYAMIQESEISTGKKTIEFDVLWKIAKTLVYMVGGALIGWAGHKIGRY